MQARQLHALRRVGVARQEVEALVAVGINRREAGIGRHGIEETRGRIGIVAGFAQHAHADHVGLEFLVAREGGEPELSARQRLLAGDVAGEHFGHHAAGDDLGLFLLLPLDAVIGRHVRHFVRQHGGDLRGIIGERQQAACHIEIAAWQREGVDRGRIQDGDTVGLVRVFRNDGQGACDARDEFLRLGILVFAAIARDDARMLACPHLGARIVLLHLVDDLRIGRRRDRRLVGLLDDRLAAGKQRADKHQRRDGSQNPAPGYRCSCLRYLRHLSCPRPLMGSRPPCSPKVQRRRKNSRPHRDEIDAPHPAGNSLVDKRFPCGSGDTGGRPNCGAISRQKTTLPAKWWCGRGILQLPAALGGTGSRAPARPAGSHRLPGTSPVLRDGGYRRAGG